MHLSDVIEEIKNFSKWLPFVAFALSYYIFYYYITESLHLIIDKEYTVSSVYSCILYILSLLDLNNPYIVFDIIKKPIFLLPILTPSLLILLFIIKKIYQDRGLSLLIASDFLTLIFISISLYFIHVCTLEFVENNKRYIDLTIQIKDDVGVFSNQDTLSHLVFEPLLGNKNDITNFENFINNNDGCNLFIDISTFNAFGNTDKLKEKFIKILEKNKNKINLFFDIEFEFEDISLPSQMALATLDSESHFKLVYDFAKKLKDRFGVDYIFGPVLDRKISTYEQTISVRSYGKNLDLISEKAIITILAFSHAGIKCIPKHFPGHPQVEKYDSNTHYGAYYTKYTDETLKDNAIPFNKVYEHPYVNIRTFMTDHIVIPSITKDIPYVLTNEGLQLAAEKFLDGKTNVSFVTDELSMILKRSMRDKNNKKANKITEKTKVILQQKYLSPVLIEMLHDAKYKFKDLNFKNEEISATLALAVLSSQAIRAGHDLVLIRGLSLEALKDYRSFFNKLIYKKDTSLNEKLKKTLLYKFRNVNFEHDKFNITSYPLIQLNLVNNELDKKNISKIKSLNTFYYSSVFKRDDIAMGIFQETENLYASTNIQYVNNDIYAIFNKLNIPDTSLEKYYNDKDIDLFIFILSHNDDIYHLKTLYEYLNKIKSLKKLVIIISNSPDYLMSTANYFKISNRDKDNENFVLDLMHTSNVFCIFENTSIVNKLLNEKSKNKLSIFYDCLPRTSLNIDIPGFHISRYTLANENKNEILDVVYYKDKIRKILGNENFHIKIYFFFIVLLLSFICTVYCKFYR